MGVDEDVVYILNQGGWYNICPKRLQKCLFVVVPVLFYIFDSKLFLHENTVIRMPLAYKDNIPDICCCERLLVKR